MKHIKNLLLGLAMVVSLGVVATPVLTHAAATPSTATDSACTAITGNTDCKTSSGVSVNSLIRTIINILSFVVGVVAVIMVIIGGFNYVTSGGDSNKVSSAKNTIIYALVGLVIVALSQVLVQFVFNQATNAKAPAAVKTVKPRPTNLPKPQ